MQDSPIRIGIVAAEWHDVIVRKLIDGAMAALSESGVASDSVSMLRCPGCYEIPVVAKAMAATGRFDAIIALGVVVRGETAHFEYVSGPAAFGLQQVALETGVPCMLGILTVDSIDQALDRAGGAFGNKGSDVAMAAIRTIQGIRSL